MRFSKSNGLIAASLMLILGSASGGFAQQGPGSAGIVRISDGRVRSTSTVQTATAQSVEQVGGHRFGPVAGDYPTGSCPTGGCPTGSCPNGVGQDCQSGFCQGCRGGCFHGHFGEHYCKHSPDYGYAPPTKYPLHRRGVEYTNYFPQKWYGAGADYSQSPAPMVYQPTDTTQLGYYYQHVPFWQPMPNRLPPRPIPSQWHSTPPAISASRYCNGFFPGQMGPYSGFSGWHGRHNAGTYMTVDGMNGSCPPNNNMGPINSHSTPMTSPQPLPGSGEIVPPIQSVPGPIDVTPRPLQDQMIDSQPASASSDAGRLPPSPSSASNGNVNPF
jgi:hypothetical protein